MKGDHDDNVLGKIMILGSQHYTQKYGELYNAKYVVICPVLSYYCIFYAIEPHMYIIINIVIIK